MRSLLETYQKEFDAGRVRAVLERRAGDLEAASLSKHKDALLSIPQVTPSQIKLEQPKVEIGVKEDLNREQHESLLNALHTFVPWKKGPFAIFGHSIDAEWRSDLKWDRIREYLGPLRGKRIADVGCHNGYFMLRAAAQDPEIVIGLEPVAKHLLNFHLLQFYAQRPELVLELLGIEDIDAFPKFFDVILCLGILYHHTDPVALLRKMRSALRPKGRLIIDCQGIPGSQPMTLVPRKSYCGAKGIWHLPTAQALEHWILRAGFQSAECFYNEPLTTSEQRPTKWAPIKSLQDFLCESDQNMTVEGYPAPHRIYYLARP